LDSEREWEDINRPCVVSAAEWQVARDALLVKEKELTRALDALAAQRRRLPMVRLAGGIGVAAPDGATDASQALRISEFP
jgi:predicted dithiol-disulfide oxidoreductase (DUF899 family)